jgi:hypothetical protein
VDHFPQGLCVCGAALADRADLGVAGSHQQVEIPLQTAQVIPHDLHEVAPPAARMCRETARLCELLCLALPAVRHPFWARPTLIRHRTRP